MSNSAWRIPLQTPQTVSGDSGCRVIHVTSKPNDVSTTQVQEPMQKQTQKQRQKQTQKQKKKQKKVQRESLLRTADFYTCYSCETEQYRRDYSNNQLKKCANGDGICRFCIYADLTDQEDRKEKNNWQRQPSRKVEGAVWGTKDTSPTVEPQLPPDHKSLEFFPPPPMAEPCSICYVYFDQGKDCKTICGHRFHQECLDQWICSNLQSGTEPTCPLCRITLKC